MLLLEIASFRKAKMLIECHGHEAVIVAEQTADDARVGGDSEKEATWRDVARAVEKLQQKKPPSAGRPGRG